MAKSRLFKLGLTGSIATGKTTIADMFKEFDVPVFDADKAVHHIYDRKDVIIKIENHFPKAVRNLIVDRDVLGKQIAKNPDKLGLLEALIHPLVTELRKEFIKKAEAKNLPVAVFDVPLLFETNSQDQYDAVLVTHCDADIQAKRALKRPGMTKKKLQTILDRQMPQAEKIRRADFIIDTAAPLIDIRPQIFDIYITCKRSGVK